MAGKADNTGWLGIAQVQREDPRGNRYVTEGTAMDDAALVGVVGRFSSSDRYPIVTVYRIVGS
jgi:hypothetical protein